MPEGISREKNISSIPYPIIKKICDGLDQKSKWRAVISVVTEKRFSFRNDEIEKIAQALHRMPSANPSPSQDLWHQYGDKGMKVYHMIEYLDKLKLEQELIMLKDPEPLVIDRHPIQQIELQRKETLKLSCKAHGFPYPRYTWYFRPDGSDNYQEIVENQSGELERRKIRQKHAGLYQCRIHNSLTRKAMRNKQDFSTLLLFTNSCIVTVQGDDGQDSEDEAPTVTIQTGYLPDLGVPSRIPILQNVCLLPGDVHRPRIIKQPGPEVIEVDMTGPIRLECLAEGNPIPYYQWMKDDILLKGENHSKLLIKRTSIKDSGLYWCLVNNGQEVQSLKVQVTVIDPQQVPGESNLEILEQPGHQTVEEFSLAFFYCNAKGRGGDVYYNWYHVKNGNITKVTDTDRNGMTLKIEGVREDTAGIYYCDVTLRKRSTGEVIATKRTCDASLEVMNVHSRLVPKPKDKVALFIGIENYKNATNLKAIPWDIKETANRFEKMGYKVISLLDLTLDEMNRAVDLLCHFVDTGVYVVLYFVGHGFYHKGNHYLMPWDNPSGIKPEECLCVEEARARVQSQHPEFLLMIVDMCRNKGASKLADSSADISDFESSVKGNSLTFFATSLDEQSWEPNQDTKKTKRGIFSQVFCDTLDSHKDKPVKEIFDCLLDKFRKFMEGEGKKYPMHPEMHHNLMVHQRRFTDPVVYNGLELEIEKRNEKFKFINQMLPEGKTTKITMAGIKNLALSLTGIKRFSNQFDLVVKVENQGAARDLKLDLDHNQKHNITVLVCCDRKSEWWFTVQGVQRIDCDFKPYLCLEYTDEANKRQQKRIILTEITPQFAVLKRPLVSIHDIWQASFTTNKNNTDLKQPIEDEELCNSFSSDTAKNSL